MIPAGLLLYRAALRLLPRRLRERHGAAMEALFEAELRRARARGRVAGVAALAAGLFDLLLRVSYERLRAGPGSVPSSSRGSTMDTLLQDLRHAVRALRGSPGFTLTAVLILALAVGANTAIFSVVRGVILEPLPFPEAERVVHLGMSYRGGGVGSNSTHYRFHWVGEEARSFDHLAAWRPFRTRTEVEGRPRAVTGLRVDDGFLETVGWPPARGRGFEAAERAPDGPLAALVSPSFAQAVFGVGADPLGRTLDLAGERYAVVGVLPSAFRFPEASVEVQVVLPLRLVPNPADEGMNYQAMGRLAPGVEAAEAQAELDAVWAVFQAEHPEQVGPGEEGPVLADYERLYLGTLGTALWLVLGAVGLILLIACANVANLLLARSVKRRREMSVRAALGATRLRVARLLVTETLVLCLLGGVAGVAVGWLSLELLLGLMPFQLPRAEGVALDAWVLAATFGLMVATGLVFGLVMTLPGARGLARTLREGGRGSSVPGRARQAFVLAQSAMAMVLLVAAGLLLGTLVELRSVDAGFDPDGLVAVSFPVAPEGYETGTALAELHRSVRERSAAEGVPALAQAFNLPLERGLNIPVTIVGRPDAYEGAVEFRGVSPDYFQVLGMEVVRGRGLEPGDTEGGERVVVVSEAFARHYFPGGDVLGQAVEVGRYEGRWIPPLEGYSARIVGVVEDVRDRSLRLDPSRTLYLPVAQVPALLLGTPVFLARGRGGAADPGTLRRALAAADPTLPRAEVRPMGRVVEASLARERFNALLLGSFAGLALLLTACGVFGVIAYDVRQRQREIGIRMALGAAPGSVLRLVAAQGLGPVVAGLVVGTAAALWLSRLLQSLVWGVSTTDPRVFVAVALLLVGVTAVASWLPARRAARVDPVRSLAAE